MPAKLGQPPPPSNSQLPGDIQKRREKVHIPHSFVMARGSLSRVGLLGNGAWNQIVSLRPLCELIICSPAIIYCYFEFCVCAFQSLASRIGCAFTGRMVVTQIKLLRLLMDYKRHETVTWPCHWIQSGLPGIKIGLIYTKILKQTSRVSVRLACTLRCCTHTTL